MNEQINSSHRINVFNENMNTFEYIVQTFLPDDLFIKVSNENSNH